MTKLENRCANCGGKFGLVSHHHWGLRFCRKPCKDNFLAKTATHGPNRSPVSSAWTEGGTRAQSRR
jgi:hypothetical protein